MAQQLRHQHRVRLRARKGIDSKSCLIVIYAIDQILLSSRHFANDADHLSCRFALQSFCFICSHSGSFCPTGSAIPTPCPGGSPFCPSVLMGRCSCSWILWVNTWHFLAALQWSVLGWQFLCCKLNCTCALPTRVSSPCVPCASMFAPRRYGATQGLQNASCSGPCQLVSS